MTEGQTNPSARLKTEEITLQDIKSEAASHPEEVSTEDLIIIPWGPTGPRLLRYKEMISSQNLGEQGLGGFYKALEDSLCHVQRGNEILQALLENHFDRTFTAKEEEDEARNTPEEEIVQATQFLRE